MLLAGIDYPYWATFNLQRVFPTLQDKLAAFPVATIYNRMIRDWPALRPSLSLFKTPDLYRKLNQLFGAYTVALAKGANAYQVSDRNPPFKTAAFIVEQTGIDRQTVVAFLSSLEKLAKEGGIDFQYWNPKKALEQAKSVTRQKKEIAAAEPKNAFEEAAGKVGSAMKWVTVALVAGAGVYALSFVPKFKGSR